MYALLCGLFFLYPPPLTLRLLHRFNFSHNTYDQDNVGGIADQPTVAPSTSRTFPDDVTDTSRSSSQSYSPETLHRWLSLDAQQDSLPTTPLATFNVSPPQPYHGDYSTFYQGDRGLVQQQSIMSNAFSDILPVQTHPTAMNIGSNYLPFLPSPPFPTPTMHQFGGSGDQTFGNYNATHLYPTAIPQSWSGATLPVPISYTHTVQQASLLETTALQGVYQQQEHAERRPALERRTARNAQRPYDYRNGRPDRSYYQQHNPTIENPYAASSSTSNFVEANNVIGEREPSLSRVLPSSEMIPPVGYNNSQYTVDPTTNVLPLPPATPLDPEVIFLMSTRPLSKDAVANMGLSGLCEYDNCQKIFDSPGSFIHHLIDGHHIPKTNMRLTGNEESYRCLWDGCTKTGITRSNIYRHVVDHAVKYGCRVCDAQVSYRADSVKRHYEESTDNKVKAAHSGSTPCAKNIQGCAYPFFKKNASKPKRNGQEEKDKKGKDKKGKGKKGKGKKGKGKKRDEEPVAAAYFS
ncbi:hypothetical protein B0H34DRAFT_800949 [Crassisporium funariophilum]|nr:hypothetical protein B0H34DRAFT_800949 [Crassisporium funariophilum]